MDTTRRGFLGWSLGAGSALALGTGASRAHSSRIEGSTLGAGRRTAAPKRILILGGTGFLGPAIVEAAKARGHAITLFNRGITEKRKGLTIDGVERLYGNRDPDKPADETRDEHGNLVHPDSPRGIESLKGHTWDGVIDDSGFYPRIVRASAELLAPSVERYIYISSISAYKDNIVVGADEDSALATLADPTVETMGKGAEFYGGLKALCEQAAEKAMPGRTALVRPGFIVGPGDSSDRFTYWPVRVSRGGEVLAPGTPADPIQVIDVRDLAAWLVKLVEDGTTGRFNACGPASRLTMGEVLETCRAACPDGSEGRSARLTWVSAEFLTRQGGDDGVDLPIWAPPSGETAGFHQWLNTRAIKAGLVFRPLKETVADLLAWYPKEIERRVRMTPAPREGADTRYPPGSPDPTKLRAGVTPEREAELLAAWHKEAGK